MANIPLKVWLTDTELRNISALYNPMTLGELQNLFNMVMSNSQNCLSILFSNFLHVGLGGIF